MNGIVIQVLVSLLLPTFMVAVGNTWTSYTLPILESSESPFGHKITKNDGSLIGSVVMLGPLVSIMFVGYLADKIGRKRTEMLCVLCNALGWSIITTARSVRQLLIGRFIIGVGTGVHFVAGPVFIGEISQSSIRGTLLSIMAFMYNVGSLISYIEGWFCSYDVVNYLNLTLAVGFLLILSCIKETPIYLYRIGKEQEAINSLKFYRGTCTVTQEIIDEIISIRSRLNNDIDIDSCMHLKIHQLEHEHEKLNQEKQNKTVVELQGVKEHQSVWSILRTSKSTQRALLTMVVHVSLGMFMGMIAVEAYAGQFFAQAAPSLSPHMCSVILASVIVIISGVNVIIVDLIPRRVLMMSSCLMCAGYMACLATMLRWGWAPDWGIPLVMALFSMSYNLGVTNVPFVQITECLPPLMYSFGTTVAMSTTFLSCFAVLLVFKPAVDTLGLDGVFLLFAIIGLLNTAITFLVMRETRRVPFEIVKKSFEQGYLFQWKT